MSGKKKNNARSSSSSNGVDQDTQNQLERFSSTLQELLSAFNAEIETSRFTVEKAPNGTRIDFAFRAIIKSAKKKPPGSSA